MVMEWTLSVDLIWCLGFIVSVVWSLWLTDCDTMAFRPAPLCVHQLTCWDSYCGTLGHSQASDPLTWPLTPWVTCGWPPGRTLGNVVGALVFKLKTETYSAWNIKECYMEEQFIRRSKLPRCECFFFIIRRREKESNVRVFMPTRNLKNCFQ